MTLAKTILLTMAAAALAVGVPTGLRAQAQAPANAPAPAAAPQKKPSKKPKAKKPTAAPAKKAPAALGNATAAAPPAARRDPFHSLLDVTKPGGEPNLPPGKAGLVIASIRVDGTVKADNGMIAVVSNPQQRVYFIHEGDRLYDGQVEKISLDGVTFRESSKDAFGKPVEREVTKRLYASAGEQQ
jgi:Tfp pilus assembly protein PilP